MKRLIIILVLFLLSACSNTNPVKTEDVEPIKTGEPQVERIPEGCEGYKNIDNAYCGYDNNSFIKLDQKWQDMPEILYDRNYEYLELAAFKELQNKEFYPVNRNMCAVCTDLNMGQYGYAGLWCDCNQLVDTLYYKDYRFILNLFDIDGLLKDEDVKTYYYDGGYILGKKIGIAYKDTLLYKALSSENDFNPIPNAYPSIVRMSAVDGSNCDLIEKTFVDNAENNHTIKVWTLESDDAYIIEFEFDDNGLDTVFGYILK